MGYGTPDECLAKSEVSKLAAMRFDPSYWSNAYSQCIGRGLSHKECVASISDDTRVTPPGPLSGEGKEVSAAITCISEKGLDQCTSHFDTLRKLGGFVEPREESKTEKFNGFCSKAGFKLLGVPVLLVALK